MPDRDPYDPEGHYVDESHVPDRSAASAPSAEGLTDEQLIRQIIWHSYSLVTQGELATQRRQPHAQPIYAIAKELLARQERRDAFPEPPDEPREDYSAWV